MEIRHQGQSTGIEKGQIMNKEIPSCWKSLLESEFEKDYFRELESFVDRARATSTVFPADDQVFNAFRLTPFSQVKAVILGQDPYHDQGQAHGLSFSVQAGVKHPPSLKNIFKELQADLGVAIPDSGNLQPWGERGVLLLNTVLTVEAHQANSHQKRGWEEFTNRVICLLGSRTEHCVFVLWGKPAQSKAKLIDADRHTLIQSPHPSPLSAHRGFHGSRPFTKVNAALKDHGQPEIDWSLDH